MPLIFSKDRLSPQTDDTLNEQHSGHITGAVAASNLFCWQQNKLLAKKKTTLLN